ncbi:hypothetical protein LZK98_01260 [Sphingomonas cannabina]|uniref:hypothetical protein n=1 Tax=Sphingomonas cannabina TaxID=2899123 RepID=UPI001F1C9721|nr:hypothetical protein [Sphingomonas cannabina]UIJ45621.1 hypothetical protein LZK98_01260 [Sphingomonas cannabina]
MSGSTDIPAGRWSAARARSAEINAGRRASAPVRMLAETLDAPATELRQRATALLLDMHWVEALLAPLVDALAADPLFDPPFKVSRDPARIGAVLFDSPGVRVSAAVLSARGLAAALPRSVVVPGHVAVTRYVHAGGVMLRRWRVEAAGADFSSATAPPAVEIMPFVLTDGDVVVQDGATDGHVAVGAKSDVVTLSVMIRPPETALVREYAIIDGRLLRASTLDDYASRGAMLLTLLRTQGRTDAGHVFEAATRDRAFHVRWSAMREWLALDARAALPRLAEMAAGDPNSEVREAAGSTLAAIRARMEAVPCPA